MPATEPPAYSQVTNDQASGVGHQQNRLAPRLQNQLQPWLELRARLFLCILSPALISLLLVAVHVHTATQTADAQADDLKDRLMEACQEAERAASLIASVPYYFADNFNDATKRSIDDTVHGLAKVLMMSVTAIERLLVFLVDMYRSFYLCVIELIVRGSLAVIEAAVDALSDAIHDVAQSLKTTIQASVNGINVTLRASLGGINDILKIIGKSVTVPQVAMPNLSALDNVQLPASFDAGLTSLNDSLPTLSELKQQMNTLIETPFEKMKVEINTTLATYSFDRTTLPVPSNQTITFCDANNVTAPVNDLSAGFHHAANVGLGILFVIALLLILACLALEWLRWRSLQRAVQHTHDAYNLSHKGQLEDDSRATERTPSKREIMSLLDLSSHPFLAEKGLQCAQRCGVTGEGKITRLRWWLAWISHPSLLAVLAMGIVGFISVQCQIWAIDVAIARGKKNAASIAQSNENDLRNAVNARLSTISLDYANRSNIAIQAAQDDVNNRLLGWVATTTTTMNNTLNQFEDGIAEVLNSTFQNTPLFTPIQSFVGCILLNKVDEIEKGLTWIHDNAHVTFPVVPGDALLLSANDTQALVQPAQDQILGNGSPNSGIVSRLGNTYLRGLEHQRTLFLIVLAVYAAVATIGALIAFFHSVHEEGNPTRKDDQPNDGPDENPDHRAVEKSSHASISAPLLEDVVKLYYERQRQREDAQEAAAQDFAVRAVESRQRNRTAAAAYGASSEYSCDSIVPAMNSILPYHHAEAARDSVLSASSSHHDRRMHTSLQSLQAPSSRIASSGSGLPARQRWPADANRRDTSREEHAFACFDRAPLHAPDDVQLTRQNPSGWPMVRTGVAM